MTSTELRQAFLNFFQSKEHQIVPSAPMVVKNDPTLMFTNAGMNQFKDVFLGNSPIKHPRIADSQKCLRVSGKHNDLEEVGHDTYHHTMFEMLGNWSFGDYFKKEAIDWAWEFLVDVLKIDRERLYATVFEGNPDDGVEMDKESMEYWKKHLPAERIILGNRKDNFWEMGDTGPCGPCSEIHIDIRDNSERQAIPGRQLVNTGHSLVIELWNLVFIQYNRKADGSLAPLPLKHVDTGMGFERLAMVVQNKKSNYDTDVFTPIIDKITELFGVKYGQSNATDTALRVMADHIRTITFSIADGQLPSNNKAGYVIRRILRRAVRYYYTFFGARTATLYKLIPTLVQTMGSAYPELIAQQDLATKVIREEEESFLRTLETGIAMLDRIIDETVASGSTTVSGKVAFELYDTFGFPLDLTELILKERGLTANRHEFEEAMDAQKQRARNASAIETADWTIVADSNSEEFVGYDRTEAEVTITKYRKVKIQNKQLYQLVFNITPFYAESGGQVGDTGYIEHDGVRTAIENTVKENNLIIHLAPTMPADPQAKFKATVDTQRRSRTAGNHSATHLMHEALREVVGMHVEQKGSLVTPDGLRFDFSHFQKVTDEQIAQVEQIVNSRIRQNLQINEMREVPIEKAKAMGAVALFGEKYGDSVRIIKFGTSMELCGGTHVAATGQIGLFRIVSESAIAAGIRRIEAITAEKAEELMYQQISTIKIIKETLGNPPNIVQHIAKMVAEHATLQKELEKYNAEKVATIKEQLKHKCVSINGINVIAEKVDISDANALKDISFQLRNEMDNLYLVLGAQIDGKAIISVMISDSLVAKNGLNASTIIREAAKEIQGGGGGQPFYATAGGKNTGGIASAIAKAKRAVDGQ